MEGVTCVNTTSLEYFRTSGATALSRGTSKGGSPPDDSDTIDEGTSPDHIFMSRSSSSSSDSMSTMQDSRMITTTQQTKGVRWREPEHVGSTSTQHEGQRNQMILPQHYIHTFDATTTHVDEHRLKIDTLLQNLSRTSLDGRLVMINLSKRGLEWKDAKAIRESMHLNPRLAVLKLSYNDLEDRGTAIVASGFIMPDGSKHPSLSVLDLGFNSMGDAGCTALALHAVAGNYKLDTLYLSGNHLKQKGAMAIAGAILHGCNLTELHLSANSIGPVGIQALARAIAEREALVPREGNGHQRTMQNLHLVGIDMAFDGFVTLASMLLTNYSMKRLCLSNNGIDDNGMALLAQSLSRNKSVPLEVIQLSFNEITCAGVECFMNAIWGSKTLKELRFDNNKLRDRGAQLAAVVLTSINLEVIDLSFNKITAVGIKALMKSLSDNSSLQYLALSGITIDPNASKALSYGLAYNSTLKYLHVDNCEIGYAAQRHIIAGVISNRGAALRVLTGFTVGAIAVTLGLPKPLEGWTNDQCLSFVRLMWKQWRDASGIGHKPVQIQFQALKQMGPAPPTDVVKAARMAFQLVGVRGAESLNTEDHQKDLSQTSPLVHTNDIMLERSLSGTLRVPQTAQVDPQEDMISSKNGSNETTQQSLKRLVDPMQKDRNLQWLRTHFQSLHQVGQLPFNEADLWQLHQYFFSPMTSAAAADRDDNCGKSCSTEQIKVSNSACSDSSSRSCPQVPTSVQRNKPLPADASHRAGMGRAFSYQTLHDARATTPIDGSMGSRRRSLHTFVEATDTDGGSSTCSSGDEAQSDQPATKRAKNFRPRISYYPRIRELLEGSKQTQQQILSVLRQLKFVEGVMFRDRNVYAMEVIHETDQTTPADAEMIILDLL